MVTALDERTALVLVDLQKGITKRPIPGVAQVLQNAAALVAAFRQAGLPIVIVNVDAAGAKWLGARKDAPYTAAPPAPGTSEIDEAIQTKPGDIFITKHTWGAFYETALHDELQKKGVTGIVLAGIATSIGVEGTARQASERAYNITFAKDAMTDMVADAHERSLQYIFPRMGEVGDTAGIIKMLGKR